MLPTQADLTDVMTHGAIAEIIAIRDVGQRVFVVSQIAPGQGSDADVVLLQVLWGTDDIVVHFDE